MDEIIIRRADAEDKPDWLRMRLLLWTYATAEGFASQLDLTLADPDMAVFIAALPDGRRVGFLEAGMRAYGEGCETSPVGYVEGIYVDEDLRGRGVALRLMRAAEDWARDMGCHEIASDTWLENEASIQMHLRLGYEEMERLVHFAKKL
ncbi:MAG: aminoglycoside 6'-N-acetyltransferase [Chloroflexota bacterium]